MNFSESRDHFRKLQESKAPVDTDTLQNEILLILHHVGDIEKAVAEKDLSYAKKGLADIKEAAKRLEKYITPAERKELDRATEGD